MCHGIIREYAKRYHKVGLFSHAHNYPSVAFMFRDLPNVTVIKGNDDFARAYIKENQEKNGPEKYDEVKTIGFENLDRTSGELLERQFYKTAGVDLHKIWTGFYVDRDFTKEKNLFQTSVPKTDYVFIHEDTPRKYLIKRELLNKNYAIFTPSAELAENFFDYCTIIEKAKEIHVIDSSFMFLIDCLEYTNPDQKLFVHRYSRENEQWKLPILKKNWHILTLEKDPYERIKKTLESLYKSKLFLFNNSLTKRTIRKIYRVMTWQMGEQTRPDLNTLVQRYVPGKTFAEITGIGNEDNLKGAWAKTSGALAVSGIQLDEKQAQTTEVLLYSGPLGNENEKNDLLKKLRVLTAETLILTVPKTKIDSGLMQRLCNQQGFEILEKNVSLAESSYVARVIN